MGESPRTTEEIDFDEALRELGMGPVTAASIVAGGAKVKRRNYVTPTQRSPAKAPKQHGARMLFRE
jgi:hypothetical protein